MNTRRSITVAAVGILGVIVISAVSVGIVILVKGTRTTSYPAVVHLSRPYCSAVAIQGDVLLTVEHCHARVGDHMWDGHGGHVGRAANAIAQCKGGLAVWRVTLDAGQALAPIQPDVSELADGAATRIVGFGLSPLSVKAYADGKAHDATCVGCANPRAWMAKLDDGFVCKGDSGGAAYTAVSSERLAGIVEAVADQVINGCGADVILHRLDSVAMDWVNDSLARYSGATLTTCP